MESIQMLSKKRSNRRNEVKLLASREANNVFKAQQKKSKSISITEKPNLFNQITITNGNETAKKFNLYGCQQKKKKKKKSVPRDQKDKGVLVSNNTEQMDVDVVPIGTHLQDEILMDILTRLPVRSLCQFKCVSKFWRTLISNSYFKMMHLNRAKNDRNSQRFLLSQRCIEDGKSSVYCLNLSSGQPVENVQRLDLNLSPCQPVENVQRLDLPLTYKPNILHISCCCDGLAIIHVSGNIDVARNIYLLWNSSTGESVVLPTPQFPDYSGICMGMVYDSTSGDYKIVATYRDGGCPGEILALKSGSWRYIDKHPRGICSRTDGVHYLPFVNGAFHWIGLLGDYFSPSRSYSVVSFSISNEEYGDIPLPEQLLWLESNIFFGVTALEGMLCVYSNFDLRGTFNIWVLKDYGVKECWTSLFTIKDPHIRYLAIPKYRFADGELLYWGISLGGKLGNAFRTTRNVPFGLWPQCDTIQAGLAFTESLISPKSLI